MNIPQVTFEKRPTRSTSIGIYPNTSIIFANILKFGLWPSKLVPVAVWPLQRLYLWPWRHHNFLPNFVGVSPVVRNSWLSWRPLLKGYHHDVARSQWRYRVPIQLQSPPHGLSWSTNIIHHQKRLSQRYNCHKLMQTSRAPVDLRDPSVALQHFPHRQDSEMVNIASWRQWMPIQLEGWAQSYCGLEQSLADFFEKTLKRCDTRLPDQQLLTADCFTEGIAWTRRRMWV